jgi:hypothetical protein
MHPKALLTDKSIDSLVRLRELLPGTTDRELIEAALVEFTERAECGKIDVERTQEAQVVAGLK